ncbi:MAG: (deoxy)nucleoside triphosphate pyrophosphohydrolase [Candidatus Acidiferrales bacterium]
MTHVPENSARRDRRNEPPLVVVAALIQSNERILACQRRKDDAFGLKWEFPGGKVRPNESPAKALERELREELGIEAQIGEEVYRTRHRYAEMLREIELIFFRAIANSSAMQNLAFEEMRWVGPAELPSLDFLPADREFIALLADGKLAISSTRRSRRPARNV